MIFYSEMKCSVGFYWNARVFIQRRAVALMHHKGVKDPFGVPGRNFVRASYILRVWVHFCECEPNPVCPSRGAQHPLWHFSEMEK